MKKCQLKIKNLSLMYNEKKIMKILKYWKPILIAVLIFYGSVSSSNTLNKISIFHIKNMDKIMHFLMYFLLSISFLSSLHRNMQLRNTEKFILAFVFVFSYGLLMEVFQYYFTVDRSAEFLDLIANTSGCLFGILSFPILDKFNITRFL